MTRAAVVHPKLNIKQEPEHDVEHHLCEMLRSFASAQGLSLESADEMLNRLLSKQKREAQQVEWLKAYIALWDASMEMDNTP